MSKRAAQVFRDAALYYLWDGDNTQIGVDKTFSCHALRSAAEYKEYSEEYIDELKRKYWEYIGCSSGSGPGGNWFYTVDNNSCANQERRFMCLLLMSEILKDDWFLINNLRHF